MKQLQPFTGLRCHHQLISQMQVTAGEPEPAPCRLPGGSSQEHWQGRGGCKADFSGGTLLGVKHLPSLCTQHKLTEQNIQFRHSVKLSSPPRFTYAEKHRTEPRKNDRRDVLVESKPWNSLEQHCGFTRGLQLWLSMAEANRSCPVAGSWQRGDLWGSLWLQEQTARGLR